MTLVIDLSPDLERLVSEAAARRGQEPAEFARVVLEERVRKRSQRARSQAGIALGDERPAEAAELPFFDRDETLEQLAAKQGVHPVGSIDELRGDFWPEDEDPDAFVTALRSWRREESDLGRT